MTHVLLDSVKNGEESAQWYQKLTESICVRPTAQFRFYFFEMVSRVR